MIYEVYPAARTAFLRGQINWEADQFQFLLVNIGYVYSSDHATLANVPAQSRIMFSHPLIECYAEDGYAKSQTLVMDTTPYAGRATGLILFRLAASEQESHLLAYWQDTVGLPFNLGKPYWILPDAAIGGWFGL